MFFTENSLPKKPGLFPKNGCRYLPTTAGTAYDFDALFEDEKAPIKHKNIMKQLYPEAADTQIRKILNRREYVQQILYRSRYDGGDFRVVQNIDGRIRLTQGDIRPTDVAPVIGQSEHRLELGMCRWGYPLSKGKNPVINARVETVMDKPSFQNGILYHRLLIPAGGFYEWNSLKEKSSFARPDSSVLYMAGFCDWFENERRFVILTTTANNSMKKSMIACL